MEIESHSDTDHLLFQIDQLEKQLQQEKINNTERNKVDYL